MELSNAPPLMQVKARIRADHCQLRALLDTLDAVVALAPRRPQDLTDAVWKLFVVLDEHLAMEERDLLPHIEAHAGPQAVAHVREEHHEQRVVLLAMVHECDGGEKPLAEILDDARWLGTSLRSDMDREDREFEIVAPGSFLSEDGFVAGQCSG